MGVGAWKRGAQPDLASHGVSELDLGSESGMGNEEEIGVSIFSLWALLYFFFFLTESACCFYTLKRERECRGRGYMTGNIGNNGEREFSGDFW